MHQQRAHKRCGPDSGSVGSADSIWKFMVAESRLLRARSQTRSLPGLTIRLVLQQMLRETELHDCQRDEPRSALAKAFRFFIAALII